MLFLGKNYYFYLTTQTIFYLLTNTPNLRHGKRELLLSHLNIPMKTTRGSTGLSSISPTQIQVIVQNCKGDLVGKLRGEVTIRGWGGWVIGRADHENDYCCDDRRDGNDRHRCRANRDQSANFSRSPLSDNNSCSDNDCRTTTLCATKISASSSPEKYRGERTTRRRAQFVNYTK